VPQPTPEKTIRPSILPAVLRYLSMTTLVGVVIWWNMRMDGRIASLEVQNVQMAGVLARLEKIKGLYDLADASRKLEDIKSVLERIQEKLK